MICFRRVGVWVLLLILAIPLSARPGEPFSFPEPPTRTDDALWDRAAALWRERDRLENLEEARDLFQSLSAAHPDQVEPELWLGRANYYLGIYFDNRTKRAHFLRDESTHWLAVPADRQAPQGPNLQGAGGTRRVGQVVHKRSLNAL